MVSNKVSHVVQSRRMVELLMVNEPPACKEMPMRFKSFKGSGGLIWNDVADKVMPLIESEAPGSTIKGFATSSCNELVAVLPTRETEP